MQVNQPKVSAAKASTAEGHNERALFEAWVRQEWPGAPLHHVRDALPVNDPRYGEYCNENIQRAWVGWQARAALARPSPAPELERGTVYVEARQCDECQHGGINDSADGLAACHDCDWTGPDPAEDKCPGCQSENCMAAACPQCGARYVLVASEEIAAPVAQADQRECSSGFCGDPYVHDCGRPDCPTSDSCTGNAKEVRND